MGQERRIEYEDNQSIRNNLNREKNYHKMSYSLVVILELNSISEVQYKKIMIIDNE